MVNNPHVESDKYGKKFSPKGYLDDEAVAFIKKENITELELNASKEWRKGNLEKLKDLSHLKALSIIAFTLKDIAPIHYLNNLRFLKILTYCNSEINFSAFPKLKEAYLEWRPRAKSIYQARTLEKIYIIKWAGDNLEAFSQLNKLRSLTIGPTRIKAIGNPNLVNLAFLGIYHARNLQSFAGIENLQGLKKLDVDTCRKITDLGPVAALKKLKAFHFCNNDGINSLKPLASLPELETVFFNESTNILDGDMTPLKSLPLKNVSFVDRRHYNMKNVEFPEE